VDGGASDRELLLAVARQEIDALREDPRLAELPGSRGTALRDHVLDLFGAVEHRMEHEPRDAAPEPARRAFARRLRQAIHVLRGAHVALPWLAATRSPTLNLGSLYMTEKCARILVGPDVDLVVVQDPEYMYATTSWPFSEMIDRTPGFKPKADRRPIVLNYPLSDSDRLLLHPIFAHELGHASTQEHGLVTVVETEFDNDPSFMTALESTVDDISSTQNVPTTQVSGSLRGLLRNWIEELLCDHLAIEVTGPAFVWAFAMFAMPFSYREPSQSHPPNTVRMRLALDHLARRGWRAYMERIAPAVTAYLDEIAADASTDLDIPSAFLRDQFLAHPEVLQEAAIARVDADSLDAVTMERAANEAAELLSQLILPVGLDDPIDGRAILIGGWQQAFRDHGDHPAGMVKALADARLQELIGKAIEMSTVAEAWESGT
jgi:hypothetical protein